MLRNIFHNIELFCVSCELWAVGWVCVCAMLFLNYFDTQYFICGCHTLSWMA